MCRYGAFYLYCGLAGLGWCTFLLLLPETQGRSVLNILIWKSGKFPTMCTALCARSLEQMEEIFSGRLLVWPGARGR